MAEWKNVTNCFREEQRHYRNTYLEIDEVYDKVIEVSLFSSQTKPYEIYFSWENFYGIVYTNAEEAHEMREKMKQELQKEYDRCSGAKKPTDDFINKFAAKYKVEMPSDIVFDEEAFMRAFMQ